MALIQVRFLKLPVQMYMLLLLPNVKIVSVLFLTAYSSAKTSNV